MIREISEDELKLMLKQIELFGIPVVYHYRRHKLEIQHNESSSGIEISLPIHLKFPDLSPAMVIILLIQSGHSAIGLMDQGLLLDHKVISTYMVRKKQGKSQVKYLKTKGKSRAGSRIRLANTTRFFENINQRLQGYFRIHHIDRIAMSCSKTLLPFLFSSRVSCPFDKKDERIYGIPKHVHRPNFSVLKNIRHFLIRIEMEYEAEDQILVNDLLSRL